MGLLDRLKRLFGLGDESTAETESPEAGPTAYECAVCGTGVEGPDATCPLCGSTDVVAADEPSEGDDSGGLDPGKARTTAVRDDPSDASERLSALRERNASRDDDGDAAGDRADEEA